MSSNNEIELLEEQVTTVATTDEIIEEPISDVVTINEHDQYSRRESDSTSDSTTNSLNKSGITRSLSYRAIWFLFRLHVLATFGGVTIGYVQTTISGVLGMSSFLRNFSHSTYIAQKFAKVNNYCSYVSTEIQLYVASLPTVVALAYSFGFWNSAKRGNKNTFTLATLALFLGFVFIQHSPNPRFQIVANVILGVGIGFLYQATPRLLYELAPEKLCARLSLIFNSSITLGSAMAAGINWRTSLMAEGWRLSYFFSFIPIFVLFCLGTLFVKRSPLWLVEKNKEEKAQEKLQEIRGTLDIESEFNKIRKLVTSKETKRPWSDVFNYMSRPALVISVTFSIFPSLLGFGIFTNYAPLLLQSIKVKVAGDAFLAPFIAYLLALVVACLQPLILLKLGRRIVFASASMVMMSTMVLAWCIFELSVGSYTYFKDYQVYLTGSIFGMYIACQTMIFGPAGPLKVSFPRSTEEVGGMLGILVSLLFNSVVSLYLMRLLCSVKQYVFLVYCCLNLLSLLFIWCFLPETLKAKTRTVLRRVWGKHWFWAYYVKGEGKVYV